MKKFLTVIICACFISVSVAIIAIRPVSAIIQDEESITIDGVRGKQYLAYAFMLDGSLLMDTLYFSPNGDFAIQSVVEEPSITVTDSHYADYGFTFYGSCKFYNTEGVNGGMNVYGISAGTPYGIVVLSVDSVPVTAGVFFLIYTGPASASADYSALDNQLTFADLFSN